jgi:HK97 family phage portal protein
MSLFRPQQREERTASLTASELILRDRYGSGRPYSGVSVTDESAMRLAAVWGCVDLIAEIVSTLPIDEYTNTGPGGSPLKQPRPRLLDDPGGDGYGIEVWLRQVMVSALLRGNEYGLVQSLDDRGYPNVIGNVHPDRVSYDQRKDQWFLDGKSIDRYPFGEAQLWHVPAYSVPGTPMGLAPISYAAQTIGLGIATHRFGAQWFGDGAHPSAMLTGELPISEDDAILLKKRIMAATHDNREPLVLGAGYKLEPIQVSPDESQFLDTMKANADDVARFFFRRPPGEGGQVTYANVEARSLDMLVYTVNPWLVRLERALTRLRPRGRYVKFNADAIVRPDTKTKAEVDAITLRAGLQTPNERRRIHDLAPLPGGDELNWPPFATSVPAEPEEEVVNAT